VCEFIPPDIYLQQLELETLNFCTRVHRVKDKLSTKWAWSGSRDPLPRFCPQATSLEAMKLDIYNLVCRLKVKSIGITHVKFCSIGVNLW